MIWILFMLYFVYADERILKTSISFLQFEKDHYTHYRRFPHGRLQLQCLDGCPSDIYLPRTVTCMDPFEKWRKCEFLGNYIFNEIVIDCEGYDNDNDTYILSGSCALRYTLFYSTAKTTATTKAENNSVLFIAWSIMFIVGLLAAFCYLCFRKKEYESIREITN